MNQKLVSKNLPAAPADDPLAPWRHGVSIRSVDGDADRHSIHTYFNVSPESPDGRYVLFYTSTTTDGHHGELRIVERSTGKQKVIAEDLHTEDAHRVAAQQWLSNGRRVAFHDERNGHWVSVVVDIESSAQRIIAENRLTGWGQPTADVLPLYGPHWNPGEHRDLQMADVRTGEIQTVVTADEITQSFPQWISDAFNDSRISIFFPIVSPDLRKVMFKLSSAQSGNVRHADASRREGLILYSMAEKRVLGLHQRWGHPAWLADSSAILQSHNFLLDAKALARTDIPGLPDFGAGHPAPNPAGSLFVTDTKMKSFGGAEGEWGIALCNLRGREFIWLHRFDQSQGARSWRISHPHPVFSNDGRRIYFNVSNGPRTRLYVAEPLDRT